MKRKKKTCKGVEGKIDPHEDYLFSGGRCQKCSVLFKLANEKDDNVQNTGHYAPKKAVTNEKQDKITRKPIKKTQKPIRQRTKKNQEAMDRENAACLSYWKDNADLNGDVYCEETGKWVGTEDHMNKHSVCHIWSKGANSFYRDDKRNMIILHPDLHTLLDFTGDNAMLRESLPKNYNRIKETIKSLNLEYHEK